MHVPQGLYEVNGMKIGAISGGITSLVMYGMCLLEWTIARNEDYSREWG
jgi:hypothetical protein